MVIRCVRTNTDSTAHGAGEQPLDFACCVAARAILRFSLRFRTTKSRLGKLETIPPRIRGVEARSLAKRLIPHTMDAMPFQLGEHRFYVVDGKRGVGLDRGAEWFFDANVELPFSHAEPTASAGTQWFGFFQFFEAEQLTEEAPRVGLATLWHCKLDVVDAGDLHATIMLELVRRTWPAFANATFGE